VEGVGRGLRALGGVSRFTSSADGGVGRWILQSWAVRSLDRTQLSVDDGVGSAARSLD
jgi:hypothetical protein